MRYRIGLVSLSVLLLSGCGLQAAPSGASDPAMLAAQRDALENPSSRYVVAGTRQYPNGTEVYVLDGKSGQICYYFVASGQGDEKAQKTDMRACAGTALNPL